VSQVQAFIEQTRSQPLTKGSTEERLNRIRAAVIEECVEKSFRHASMANIAKRARVSTASLYREFSGREALLEDVAKFAAPMIASEFTREIGSLDPQARLQALLIHHGNIYQNSHVNWLYRAHVSGEVLEGRGLIPIGKDTRDRIEAFWAREVSALESISLATPPETCRIVNFLLGGVQRRTLLSMLLFGLEDQARPNPEMAVQAAVDWLVALHGTSHSWPDQGHIDRAKLVMIGGDISAIKLHVKRDLAHQHDRMDVAARHQRILAAAVQECSEVGFKHASMAGVAHRANVSTATLYDHFKDKDDMFVKSVAYMVPILTEVVVQTPQTDDPRERVAQMLINHGQAYLDPFMAWLYRLYVSFEGQSDSVAIRLGQASRALIEQFWCDQLMSLENEGYLEPCDHATMLNILLGGIERRTLIAFLLFGLEPDSQDQLVDAAVFAAEALFKRLGTAKYNAEFAPKVRVLEPS
jgi:AcrR family transcriptional regulator